MTMGQDPYHSPASQIVMLRLREISPNCAQIVLEKEKNHTFFTRKIEIFIGKSLMFLKKLKKKNEKILETKNQC